MLVVGGAIAAGVFAAVIVLVVRQTDSSKSAPYVPHSWQQAPAPTSEPGWFPDHGDPNVLRYFDGRQWTPSTRPRQP